MSSYYRSILRKHNELLTRVEEPNADSSDLIPQVHELLHGAAKLGETVEHVAERARLRSILRYWSGFIYDQTRIYPDVELQPFVGSTGIRLWASLRWLIPLLLLVLAIAALVASLPQFGLVDILLPTATPTTRPTSTPLPTTTPTLSPIECNYRSLYGFESDTMGWEPHIKEETETTAVWKVSQSSEQVRSGTSSLELQVKLGKRNVSGEVHLALQYDTLPGLIAPLDLEGVPISIWVYVPGGAVAADPKHPNGVQVFVKDGDQRSEYGTWLNLDENNTDRWVAVSLRPSKTPPESGYMDPGFDPSQITWIGLKIGLGEDSDATYTGPIWIDDVCWPIP